MPITAVITVISLSTRADGATAATAELPMTMHVDVHCARDDDESSVLAAVAESADRVGVFPGARSDSVRFRGSPDRRRDRRNLAIPRGKFIAQLCERWWREVFRDASSSLWHRGRTDTGMVDR